MTLSSQTILQVGWLLWPKLMRQPANDAGHQTPDALASARPSVSTFHSTTTSAESAA